MAQPQVAIAVTAIASDITASTAAGYIGKTAMTANEKTNMSASGGSPTITAWNGGGAQAITAGNLYSDGGVTYVAVQAIIAASNTVAPATATTNFRAIGPTATRQGRDKAQPQSPLVQVPQYVY